MPSAQIGHAVIAAQVPLPACAEAGLWAGHCGPAAAGRQGAEPGMCCGVGAHTAAAPGMCVSLPSAELLHRMP